MRGRMQRSRILFLLALLSFSCATSYDPKAMNHAAESYVKLVLAMGEHDADYVDAYYGPPEWRAAIKSKKRSLDEIRAGAVALHDEIAAMPMPFHDAMLTLRRAYLTRQLEALIARVDIVKGKKMKFDEESKAIYDSVAPHHDEAYFENLTRELDRELPGKGAIADRL